MSAITLRYTSTRSEVWRWYWSLWRKKLWMHHTYFLVCILAVTISLDGHWPPRGYSAFYGLLAAAALIGAFIVYPQLMFKPQERRLTVGEGGIDTLIGRKSGTIQWADITAIHDGPDVIMISRKNGNAFLIPHRAFNSERERSDFLASVRSWRTRAIG